MKLSELKNIDKQETGFRIPEGYFEVFETKIMQQITTKNGKTKNTVIALFHRKRIWMSSIAAVFVVTIAIPLYFNGTANTSMESYAIEHYLMQQQNVTTTEIVPHLTDEDITALATSLGVSATECDDMEAYLSESEHIEYILND
ncbi:hypothetical protein [Flavobacterium sp.]|jgi:hypothetical protein|uniref:hypothetical protein n=1 Tax=Flavobacterium sp. TaxID=239 RepID=UPI0037C0AC66